MVLASDPSTVWEWLGFVAIMGTLVGLVGHLVRQARRRDRARREAAKAIAASLPAGYRFRPESLRFRIIGGVVFVCAAVLAHRIGGATATAIAAAVVGFPLYAVALRHRSQHQRSIIRSVRRDAPDMNDEQLRDLVEALEYHHGDVEMRPLRRLLDRRLQGHATS